VVSAHNFEALGELLEALRAPRGQRPSYVPPSPADAAGAMDGAAATDGDLAAGKRPAPPPLSLPITQHMSRRWTPWRA
jgi:hypothetical protein